MMLTLTTKMIGLKVCRYTNLVLLFCAYFFSTTSLSQNSVTNAAGLNDFGSQLLITLENPISPGMRGAGSTWKGWNRSGGYRTSTPVNYRVSRLAKEFDLELIDQWPIKIIDVHCIVVSLAKERDINQIVSDLSEHPYVESVQLMQMFATQTRGYNDPLVGLQKSADIMSVFSVHQWTQGKGVKLGIIDTGVNIYHPDLKGQVRRYKDFVKQKGDSFADDEHGTAVAGIIAAIANNDEGIVGVAPQTDIYAYKACWPKSEKKQSVCSSFTLAQALAAAIENNIDVLNLSLTGPKDPLLERILKVGIDRGLVVVGAVTEKVSLMDQFPASIPGVIAVRESSAPSQVVSNGLVPKVFSAPGIDILTTTALGKYNYQSGSSLSTAHVSGVVALLKEMEPDLNYQEIVKLLDGDDVYSQQLTGPVVRHEHRDVNACASLNVLLKSRMCDSQTGLESLESRLENNRASSE